MAAAAFRALAAGIAMLSLLAGCATVSGSRPWYCGGSGFSEIRSDGTLEMTFVDGGGTHVQTIARDHPEYENYRVWAGSPATGERRPLPAYIGVVSMDRDGVIRVTEGGGDDHGIHVEPRSITITPDSPAYQATIDQFGGLERGQFKGIPAPPTPACGTAPETGS